MEKNVSLSEFDDENYSIENATSFKCSECGEEFRKPILATVSSNVGVQKYFACPRCLTKVSSIKSQKDKEAKKTRPLTKETKKAVAKIEEGIPCNHSLGYLKKRPKNTPIPEECLTCNKMIECLTH